MGAADCVHNKTKRAQRARYRCSGGDEEGLHQNSQVADSRRMALRSESRESDSWTTIMGHARTLRKRKGEPVAKG